MLHLQNTISAQTINIPYAGGGRYDSYSLILKDTANNGTISLTLSPYYDINPLYYQLRLTLPSGMKAGEYSFALYSGGDDYVLLAIGLAAVGETVEHQNTIYGDDDENHELKVYGE